MGKVARISDISGRLSKDNSKTDQARVAFLANLSPSIAVIDDNDHFFHSIGLAGEHTEKGIRDRVNKIIEAISGIGEPTDIKTVAQKVGSGDIKHTEALAGISKNIATLNGRWGLIKWPMVNPKNIRDKIYVILHDNKKPMHFNEIAEAIKDSDFKAQRRYYPGHPQRAYQRQALCTDWAGYLRPQRVGLQKGTVADVIAEVLKKKAARCTATKLSAGCLKAARLKKPLFC